MKGSELHRLLHDSIIPATASLELWIIRFLTFIPKRGRGMLGGRIRKWYASKYLGNEGCVDHFGTADYHTVSKMILTSN